jgi:hypothetical protein
VLYYDKRPPGREAAVDDALSEATAVPGREATIERACAHEEVTRRTPWIGPAKAMPGFPLESHNCSSPIGDLVVLTRVAEVPAPYRLVTRSPSELHPHSSWVKHNLGLSVARLSAIATNWNPSQLDPISITRDGTILKGHEVCELARRMRLESVSGLEYDLDEAEALLWIIQHSHRDQELNPYHRIVLALDYEPSFRERARENQRAGGQFKGLTTLSEAQAINCRREIARLAGVSEGTLAKVRRLLQAGCPELLEALREGEVSIDCAFGWLRNPEKQLDQLTLYRSQGGITRTIDSLLHRHRIADSAGKGQFDIQRIGSALVAMDTERKTSVLIGTIRTPGKVILLSNELLQALESQGELYSHEAH